VCKNTMTGMEILPFDAVAKLLRVTVGWDIDA
jgi:hypothetical protein